jgi:hypothetical protein
VCVYRVAGRRRKHAHGDARRGGCHRRVPCACARMPSLTRGCAHAGDAKARIVREESDRAARESALSELKKDVRAWVHLCVCVCVCACVRVCVHACVYLRARPTVCVRGYVCICVCVCLFFLRICSRAHVSAHACEGASASARACARFPVLSPSHGPLCAYVRGMSLTIARAHDRLCCSTTRTGAGRCLRTGPLTRPPARRPRLP